jgi:hypothetical protein
MSVCLLKFILKFTLKIIFTKDYKILMNRITVDTFLVDEPIFYTPNLIFYFFTKNSIVLSKMCDS